MLSAANGSAVHVQMDMNLPQRFDISYIGEDGEKHQPVMLHRALFGSIERFLGILIENHAGKLPLWLSPEQVVVCPIVSEFDGYAEEVADKLRRRRACMPRQIFAMKNQLQNPRTFGCQDPGHCRCRR